MPFAIYLSYIYYVYILYILDILIYSMIAQVILLHYAHCCAENLTEALSALVPICRIVSYVIFSGGEYGDAPECSYLEYKRMKESEK